MSAPSTATVTNKDNGGEVSLHPGDILVVRLPSSQGAGGEWNLVSAPSSPLQLVQYSTTSLSGPPAHPGAPFLTGGAQVEIFRFSAKTDPVPLTSELAVWLRLVWLAPSQPDLTGAQLFRLHVRITPA